jgi:hypothetical protein
MVALFSRSPPDENNAETEEYAPRFASHERIPLLETEELWAHIAKPVLPDETHRLLIRDGSGNQVPANAASPTSGDQGRLRAEGPKQSAPSTPRRLVQVHIVGARSSHRQKTL